MVPRFSYDTYQDVRHNLCLYSIAFLNIAGFFAYNFILPPAAQTSVEGLISTIGSSSFFHGLSGLVVFTLIAFVLTEIIQIHDRWYDHYVIKWRFRYATDFILPRLIHPCASQVSYIFYKRAEENVTAFQEKLYYPYVGDRDTKIPKNKLVRFYEVVTIYWLTQINEIVIVGLFCLIALFKWVGPNTLEYRSQLLNSSLVLALVFVFNRAWVRVSRERVRKATDAEIEEILGNFKDELKTKIVTLCDDYAIPYSSQN